MPLYMDRHYVEGATAHAVATAHAADLALQDKYGVRFVTYWFDEDRSTAFCLVDSPDGPTIAQLHHEAHGLVPNEILEVDPSVVQSFLGGVADPTVNSPQPTPETVEPAFRAIMFTDLKDSTRMTSMLGDSQALHLLHVHNALTRNEIRAFDGLEIKHTGDGLMASFRSVPDSVACASAIQLAFEQHNSREPDHDLQVRIGLHAGEPIEEHGDLFGSAVQLAARLCAAALPGQVLVSTTVRDSCPPGPVRFIERGAVAMKGFLSEVPTFSVEWEQNPPPR